MTHINNSISVISNEPPHMIYLTEGRYGGCIVCICIPTSFEFWQMHIELTNKKREKSKKSKKTKNLSTYLWILVHCVHFVCWVGSMGVIKKRESFGKEFMWTKNANKHHIYTKLIDINNKPQEDRRLIVTQLLSDKTLDFFCLIILRTSNNTMGLKC